ncbi:hypothetical protein ACO2Q2_13300 [Dyella sp. KRB-257]|uniref:hypothetical protein n=1 Tax=Dyella sp. KRB-257 TaxID=3400915 RepID=UPI003C105B5B
MSKQAATPAPDETPTDTQTAAAPAPAADATAADAADNPPPEPSADGDAAALAAFDEGLKKLSGEPKTAADVAAKAADGKDTAAAPAPADAPAAAPAAAAPTPAAAEPDEETERAVKELGLKGRAEERFREMAGTIREVTPLRDALAELKITSPEQIRELAETSQRAIEWEETVMASTATPEQFGSALNVIRAVNSGDPKAMGVAFDAMLNEVVELGRKIGREVPGLVDPLAAHPDLAEEVEQGDITRKRALEIISQRVSAQHLQEANTRRETQEQWNTARDAALTNIQQLNDTLKAADPDFARKLPLLQPALDLITTTMHPSQWHAAVQQAYAKIPALPPVAAAPAPAPAPARSNARPPVSHMPARPTGINASMQAKPKTDLEAFEMGLNRLKGVVEQ